MAMTPEEYAARELQVPGWDDEEPVYAPGSDPNIVRVLSDEEPASPGDLDITAITHEFNFTLPLTLRRAELVTKLKEHALMDARTNFWNCLSFAVVLIPILSFIAVLVK